MKRTDIFLGQILYVAILNELFTYRAAHIVCVYVEDVRNREKLAKMTKQTLLDCIHCR